MKTTSLVDRHCFHCPNLSWDFLLGHPSKVSLLTTFTVWQGPNSRITATPTPNHSYNGHDSHHTHNLAMRSTLSSYKKSLVHTIQRILLICSIFPLKHCHWFKYRSTYDNSTPIVQFMNVLCARIPTSHSIIDQVEQLH